jgi:fructokinase
MEGIYGGVEGGGTKFSCLLGRGPAEVVAARTFPTAGPRETLDAVVRFFQEAGAGYRLEAVGVACFGPIDLDPRSPTYGYVTTTPKPGWANTDVVGVLRARLGVPVGWDTDVNGAALGERRWGAAQGADPAVYVTVGTGIGGGAYVNGAPVHGLLHPEMGHLLVPRLGDDDFPGVCPYHGRCWEGVANGPALAARAGRPPSEVPPDDPLWELEAQYLAWGVKTITDVLSPQRVVLGGGVMEQLHLFPRIRRHVQALHNGYLRHPAILDDIDAYIVPPGLGARSGVLGALELARLAVTGDRRHSAR